MRMKSQPYMLANNPSIAAETDRRHGIDLKNPFTMSKTHAALGRAAVFTAERVSPSNWIKAWSTGGGAYRDRTDDLKLAKLALSQLS